MRVAVALLVLSAGCVTAPPVRQVSVMPIELPTDTLRVEFSRAEFDRPAGVLRLAGRVLVRGPQTPGWITAGGAQITLRPSDQDDRSSGTPFVPALRNCLASTLSPPVIPNEASASERSWGISTACPERSRMGDESDLGGFGCASRSLDKLGMTL